MAAIVFIGDELTATAYGLAGVTVYSPSVEQLQSVFHQARRSAQMLIITEETARRLQSAAGRESWMQSLMSLKPLICLVPDILNRSQPADMTELCRRELGGGGE